MRLRRKSARQTAKRGKGSLRFSQTSARDLRTLFESSRTPEDRFNLFSGALRGMDLHFY
jgi:hypothetical protein